MKLKFAAWKFPPKWFEVFLYNAIHQDRDPPLWPLKGPDPDDLIFLSLAYHQGACLVTGNEKDYPQKIRRSIILANPSNYLDWLVSIK